MAQKIILGLSGGVDSAVAARLLQQRGFEVLGLFLDSGNENEKKSAEAAANYLKIELTVRDIRSELEENVCRPFAEAYLRGETPNPCVICNPRVKFKGLCNFADEKAVRHIATGHYARAENGRIFKGRPENDQSYMLCRLSPEQVSRLVLPLGERSKAEVRDLAKDMDLPVAEKPASMEICFIPDNDYAGFIERRGAFPPQGNFVDCDGNILGRHLGIHRYTIGQRRRLGVALGTRCYVSEIRAETNEVVLSYGDELMTDRISVLGINWISLHEEEFRADVRIRHSKQQTPARVKPCGDSAEIVFDTPVRAPTAGQSAVLYAGDELIGGGFIKK